jgi:hypothetical protein
MATVRLPLKGQPARDTYSPFAVQSPHNKTPKTPINALDIQSNPQKSIQTIENTSLITEIPSKIER